MAFSEAPENVSSQELYQKKCQTHPIIAFTKKKFKKIKKMHTPSKTILLILRKPHTQMFSLNLQWQGQVIILWNNHVTAENWLAPLTCYIHKRVKDSCIGYKEQQPADESCACDPLKSIERKEGRVTLCCALWTIWTAEVSPSVQCGSPFPFPYTTVMPLVLKSLQQLVNQNCYIQVNALQLVDLGIIALTHEHPLTGRAHSSEVNFI